MTNTSQMLLKFVYDYFELKDTTFKKFLGCLLEWYHLTLKENFYNIFYNDFFN
jgi:hypothetical protein